MTPDLRFGRGDAPTRCSSSTLEPPDGWDGGRAAVAASQRARMLDAVVRAVAEPRLRATSRSPTSSGWPACRGGRSTSTSRTSRTASWPRTGRASSASSARSSSGRARRRRRLARQRLRAGLEAYTRDARGGAAVRADAADRRAGRGAARRSSCASSSTSCSSQRFHALSEQAAAQDPRIRRRAGHLPARARRRHRRARPAAHPARGGRDARRADARRSIQIAETVIEFGGRRA